MKVGESLSKVLEENHEDFSKKIRIYSTNISVPKFLSEVLNKGKNENLLNYIHMDNSKNEFPESISEKKFDMIVMSRGLCQCEENTENKTCAGILCDKDKKKPVEFLKMIGKALSDDNHNAFAILHGGQERESWVEKKKYWEEVVEKVNIEESTLKAELIVNDKGRKIVSFGIRIEKK